MYCRLNACFTCVLNIACLLASKMLLSTTSGMCFSVGFSRVCTQQSMVENAFHTCSESMQ